MTSRLVTIPLHHVICGPQILGGGLEVEYYFTIPSGTWSLAWGKEDLFANLSELFSLGIGNTEEFHLGITAQEYQILEPSGNLRLDSVSGDLIGSMLNIAVMEEGGPSLSRELLEYLGVSHQGV